MEISPGDVTSNAHGFTARNEGGKKGPFSSPELHTNNSSCRERLETARADTILWPFYRLLPHFMPSLIASAWDLARSGMERCPLETDTYVRSLLVRRSFMRSLRERKTRMAFIILGNILEFGGLVFFQRVPGEFFTSIFPFKRARERALELVGRGAKFGTCRKSSFSISLPLSTSLQFLIRYLKLF